MRSPHQAEGHMYGRDLVLAIFSACYRHRLSPSLPGMVRLRKTGYVSPLAVSQVLKKKGLGLRENHEVIGSNADEAVCCRILFSSPNMCLEGRGEWGGEEESIHTAVFHDHSRVFPQSPQPRNGPVISVSGGLSLDWKDGKV